MLRAQSDKRQTVATSNLRFAKRSQPSEYLLRFSEELFVQKLRGNVSVQFLSLARRSTNPRHFREVANMVYSDFQLLFCTCQQQTTFLRSNTVIENIVHRIIDNSAWLQKLRQRRIVEEALGHIVPSRIFPVSSSSANISTQYSVYPCTATERMSRVMNTCILMC